MESARCCSSAAMDGAATRIQIRSPASVKRRSPVLGNIYWRDWANLGDGPAGLIAERVLDYDVADYIRFRAVCCPWRQCCTEPRSHSVLDCRFHPLRWILLREPLAAPGGPPRFLNTSTGECIQVHIPELHDHQVLALTSEGLLVLLSDRNHIRLLNPLTRHLAQLPPLTTVVPTGWWEGDLPTSGSGYRFSAVIPEWTSGILNDDSTVVLHFRSSDIIGVAKIDDVCWKLLKFKGALGMTSSMFEGRFYCVMRDGVKVMEDQPPRLELAAELPLFISSIDRAYLVDCAGELMLVHSQRQAWNNVHKWRYDAYRVDLDTGTLCRVNNFGGGRHALFIGMSRCLSVPIEVFPPGSIRGGTIYLSFDFIERKETEGYHVADKRKIRSCNPDSRLMARPHTLVDCLSLCCTSWFWD